VISELRRYRIKPDRLDSWLAFFATAAREQVRLGIRVEYVGVDRETATFVWLRSFDDEADRVAQKDRFYGSDWWNEREAYAMDHVIEYDVTFLDAAIVRTGDELLELSFDPLTEPAGSRGDAAPDGWQASTRRTNVRQALRPAAGSPAPPSHSRLDR
jgi:hypothetical protein